MQVTTLPIESLRPADWNSNIMDEAMLSRLQESLARFGLVQNLVVRRLEDDSYEVLGGNQRLQALREIGVSDVPCVVAEVDDAQARLLAQALNAVQGQDDLGLKAELVRDLLKAVPESEILAVLPETAGSLRALASLGEADLAEHLRTWEKAQAARLRHLIFQLSNDQLEVVEEAMERASATNSSSGSNPNRRGNALHHICVDYLARSESP